MADDPKGQLKSAHVPNDVNGSADAEELRCDNLDEDTVSDQAMGSVVGGVNLGQLRRENLEKDAAEFEPLALRGEDLEELRRSRDK